MAIPFNRDGFALPVAQALLALLNQEVAHTGLDLDRLTQLTFNFRSPTYSPEQGGAHPVEIRLIRGLDGWLFGPLPGVEARELFALWQRNFISYAQLGYFTVTVSGE